MKREISDELMNSFVDGELAAEERDALLSEIEKDPILRAEVCELRSMKEKLRHAYEAPVAQPAIVKKRKTSLAAAGLLVVGLACGWVAGHAFNADTLLLKTISKSDTIEAPRKIIIQVSDSNPARMKSALDEIDNLQESSRREHRALRIELIASAGGVDLLRADVSPLGNRVEAMMAKYPGVDFLACNQTLGKLRERGVKVELLPHAGVAASAVELIDRRLQDGWDYVRV